PQREGEPRKRRTPGQGRQDRQEGRANQPNQASQADQADQAGALGEQDAQAELVFSSRHACPICGYSVPPLEPKLFSFNNPAGACPTCDGLGTQQFFDPQRVVTHPDLSLASGAVRGWDRRNTHYFHLIQSLARHYRFDIEVPWTELPERARQVLLYGSGDEVIEFRYSEGPSEGR